MASQALDRTQDVGRNLEHEFDLVRGAIALLAAGSARRITLVGLPLDSPALREITSLVRANGMALRSEIGHGSCDITIEAGG